MTVPNLANGAVITETYVDAVTNDVNQLLTFQPSASAVTTSQTTTSSTYTDLATTGPTVTMTTGTLVRVTIQTRLSVLGGSGSVAASLAVSGATSITAGTIGTPEVTTTSGTANSQSASTILTVTAGSNTFTMKYKSNSGGTATFSNRVLVVERLN